MAVSEPRRLLTVVLVVAMLFASPATTGLVGASNHLTNAGPVTGPAPISAPSGPTITVQGSADVNLTDPFPDANTVELVTSKGNATFSAPGDAQASVHFDDLEGPFTNVTAIDTTTNALTVNTSDKPEFTVDGDVDSVNVSGSIAIDDDTTDFLYAGTSGTTTLTLNGLPADTEIAAVDIGTNEILDVSTSDGSGQATFQDMPNSEHTVELMTSDGAPVVDNSSASPQGGEGQTSRTIDLEIPVKDPDFPNDNVTVEFYFDGSLVDTQHITSNQTVNTTIDTNIGGTHTWNITATDGYGQVTNSETFEFQLPSNVTIREEAEPHEIIKQATVRVLISGSGDTVDQQTVSDGNISLVGLPVDERYVVVVNADGYHQRSIYAPSVFEQASVFLLNESVRSCENTFIVEDNTGVYTEPIIELQRAVNRSLYDSSAPDGYSWLTIAGDRLGASDAYTVDLECDARYRLTIRQGTNSRVLGEHTAEANGTVPLSVGQIEWSLPENQQYNWSFARIDDSTAASGESLRFTYNDNTDSTTSLSGTIYESGNETNVLTTFSTDKTLGKYVLTQQLSEAEAEKSWQVEWTADRNNETVKSTGVDDLQRLGGGVPLFATFQNIDPNWRAAITLTVILGSGFIVGGIFSAIGALIVVGVSIVLWLVGLSSLGVGLMLLSLVSAIGYRLAAREAI